VLQKIFAGNKKSLQGRTLPVSPDSHAQPVLENFQSQKKRHTL